MAKRRKRSPVDAAVRVAIHHVKRGKALATGITWRRLHGIESQLETIVGTKPPIRNRHTPQKRKRKAKPVSHPAA